MLFFTTRGGGELWAGAEADAASHTFTSADRAANTANDARHTADHAGYTAHHARYTAHFASHTFTFTEGQAVTATFAGEQESGGDDEPYHSAVREAGLYYSLLPGLATCLPLPFINAAVLPQLLQLSGRLPSRRSSPLRSLMGPSSHRPAAYHRASR